MAPRPDAGEDFLGLVPRPGRLSGGRRWQMMTVASRDHIFAVAWDAAGRTLACSDEGGTIRLFEVDGAKLRLTRALLGHRSCVFDLAWGRSGRLASASEDGTVRVWEPDGRPAAVLRGHGGTAFRVAWDPQGRTLLSGGHDGTVRLWDVSTGQHRVLWEVAGHGVAALGWSDDGHYLAAAAGQSARVWRADDLRPITVDHGHMIWDMAWVPGRHELATGGRDRHVRMWTPQGRPAAVLPVAAVRLAWHPDGDRFVHTTDRIPSGLFLTSRDGADRGRLPFTAPGPPKVMAWSPDGRSLGVGCNGGGLAVWPEGGVPALAPRWGAPPIEPSVSWDAAGRLLTGPQLAVWSADGTRAVRVPRTMPVAWARWTADGHILAYAPRAQRAVVVTAAGEVVRELPSAGGGVLSHDGRLATKSADGRLFQVWERDGTPGPTTPVGPRGEWTSGMVWDPTGKRLAITALGELCLWDTQTAQGLRGIAREGTEGFGAPAWSPDGRWLAAVNERRILMHRSDGAAYRRWEAHRKPITRLAWSPDGRWLASASQDGTLRLWTPDGEAGPAMELPQYYAQALAWGPDGRIAVASGSHLVSVLRFEAGRLDPLWIGLLAGDGAVAFDAAGRVVQGDRRLIDEQFACVVEDAAGAIEIVPPSRLER